MGWDGRGTAKCFAGEETDAGGRVSTMKYGVYCSMDGWAAAAATMDLSTICEMAVNGKLPARGTGRRRSAVATMFGERVVDGRRVGVDAGDGTYGGRQQGDRVHERAQRGALVPRPVRQVGQGGEDHGEGDASDRAHQRHEQIQVRHRAGGQVCGGKMKKNKIEYLFLFDRQKSAIVSTRAPDRG